MQKNVSILASSGQFVAYLSVIVIVRRLEIPPPPAAVSKHTQTHTRARYSLSAVQHTSTASAAAADRATMKHLYSGYWSTAPNACDTIGYETIHNQDCI